MACIATTAAASSLFEIQSGQVALQTARNADLRAFAQMMVDQHTLTSPNLVAAGRQPRLSPTSPVLPSDKANKLGALRAASDAQLDAMYMREQLAAHQEALAIHPAHAQGGGRPALRATATKATRIVRSHRKRAQSLATEAD